MITEDSKSVLIMVIDDQLQIANETDDRTKTYGKWLAQVSEFHNGKWTFDIRYCASLQDVANISVAPGQPSLAIVDMVLEGGAWTTTAVGQLDEKLLLEKWPMVLVSARFDSSQAIQRANKLVGKAASNAPFHFLTWASISRAVDGYDSNEVAFIVGAILSRAQGQDLRFKKEVNDTIEILHITDPHFGKSDWNVGALISLRMARKKCGLAIADFLAITGDIADRGTPDQYKEALEYFEALANNQVVVRTDLGLPKDRVFVCPGNHDFSRTLALGANMSNMAPYMIADVLNEENSWIRPYAWAPYEAFDERITEQTHRWVNNPGFRINTRFSSSGLIVLELNVERYAIEGYQDGISEKDLKKSINSAVAAVEAVRKNSECLLVLAHRHESNAWQELSQMIQSNLQGLAMSGPLIFLCGHEHSADISPGLKERALFVRGVPPNSGPSLPKLVLPMINSVSLRRENGAITGVTVHQFKQDVTGWVLDVDGPSKYGYASGKWRADA
jgi:predicted MPP superfamily phosphohydrolase